MIGVTGKDLPILPRLVVIAVCVFLLLILSKQVKTLINAAELEEDDVKTDGYCTEVAEDGTCLAVNTPTFMPTTTTGQGNRPTHNIKIAKGSNERGEPPKGSLTECSDRYPDLCPDYAARGECENNPGWMIVSCPISCNVSGFLTDKVT